MLSRSITRGSALFFMSYNYDAERKEVKAVFFEDRSREAYRKAAEAVQNGTANSSQKAMNDRASRQVGKMGDDARAAQKGELKSN